MGNAMGGNAAAADSYAQTYGGYGGPAAAANFPAGAFPGAAGAFPGAAGAFPGAAGAFPGAAGAYPGTFGAFPAAYPATAGAVPSAFPGTVASPALVGPAAGYAPVATGYQSAPAPTQGKKKKGTKESRFLDKEYAERIQAETALAYGNYAGATWHDARADRWGVKADKAHFRSYNKGGAGTPYAFHPIAPAAGIAAVQPGMFAGQQSSTPKPGVPLFADAVQVGLYGAPTAVAGYPGATVLPATGVNPYYGF